MKGDKNKTVTPEKNTAEIRHDKKQEAFYRCMKVLDETGLSCEEAKQVCDAMKITFQITPEIFEKEIQKHTRLLKAQIFTAITSTAAIVISLISIICKIVG